MAKKSFYIFLSSLLGVLLFLILHRIIVFVYLYLVAAQVFSGNINYYQFLAWDYFSLVITLMMGAWYGVWLGLYWFQRVYEEGSHGGIVAHISEKIFFPRPKTLGGKMYAIKDRLEKDLWELENLTNVTEAEVKIIEPIKRKVVRKKAPKKSSLKI
jgi:hypothetical protein